MGLGTSLAVQPLAQAVGILLGIADELEPTEGGSDGDLGPCDGCAGGEGQRG